MHALLENAITYSYDNSKVVVTGTVQRSQPHLLHPSFTGTSLTDRAEAPDTGRDPRGGRPEIRRAAQ